MEQNEHLDITREEIKKEFQLERMILFSDAVFAIVITLMAIEIRLPETHDELTIESLPVMLKHLLPVIFAYMVSFFFIGTVWYQHLKIFSILKDYDKGLVIRNLFLLFLVGLFPFCASLLTRAKGNSLAFFIYIGIILLCIIAQYFLYHYIVVQRPALRVNVNIDEHIAELNKRKISLIGFIIAVTLIVATYVLIPNKDLKPLSTLWMTLFAIIYSRYAKKKKKQMAVAPVNSNEDNKTI
ncbi:MAG: TMEM175 family protein [Ferruginibacter sp.]